MNEITESQRRRAVNQIWNAARDYAFFPDFKAFDAQGNAELYWNSVIGAVRRHYEYQKLLPVFASFSQYEEADEYEALLWMGLENAVYQKEVLERPKSCKQQPAGSRALPRPLRTLCSTEPRGGAGAPAS